MEQEGYRAYQPTVRVEEASRLPPGDLRPEIAIVRAAIQELVGAGLPIEALIDALNTGTGALARLFRVNKLLTEQEAGVIDEAVRHILTDLGKGGE